MTLVEGQKLWLVPKDSRSDRKPKEVVVCKVGRKWADLDIRGRVNIDTMMAEDGGYSIGKCHVDRDAYEQQAYRDRLWSKLRNGIAYKHSSDDLTSDNILAAAKLLGINLSTVEKPEQSS